MSDGDDFPKFEQVLYAFDQYVRFPLEVKYNRLKRQIRQQGIKHPVAKEFLIALLIVVICFALGCLIDTSWWNKKK